MRHKYNKLLEINTWVKKRSTFTREMITNLVRTWKVVTTPKRAKVLKAAADSFFSKLVDIATRYKDEKDSKREVIRYVKSVIYGEDEGKKVVKIYLEKYLKEGRKSSFIETYKMWYRKGDAVEEIMLKLM